MQATETENSTTITPIIQYHRRRQYAGWLLVGLGTYAVWAQLGAFILTALGK